MRANALPFVSQGLALVGFVFPLIGCALALIGQVRAVGQALAVIGRAFPLSLGRRRRCRCIASSGLPRAAGRSPAPGSWGS